MPDRRAFARRLTAVPSQWMCVPMWARLWDGGRRLVGRGRRTGKAG